MGSDLVVNAMIGSCRWNWSKEKEKRRNVKKGVPSRGRNGLLRPGSAPEKGETDWRGWEIREVVATEPQQCVLACDTEPLASDILWGQWPGPLSL